MAKTAAQNETIEIVDTTPLLMGLAKLKKKRAAELGNFQNPVEQKIAELSRETKAYLGSNGNSEEAVKAKIREVIKESEIKTKNEEINELAETIAKESGINNKTEVNIQAKKIRLEIEKWQREHPLEVNNFRKEQFQKEFLSEAKKLNSNLSEKQLSDLKDFSKLVAENSFKENIIDSQKDEALTANSQVSPGKLESAWSDLRTTTNFLDKKPEEVDGIKNKYNSLRESLDGVTLPSNRFTRSFDNVITSFDNPDINALLSKFRRKFGGSSFDKINNLTGGWLNRTISGAGERLAGKIGNQAIGDFVKNSLGTFAQQGFKQGMSTILNGILKGGVKAVAGTAVKGGVAAAAGAATGGLATLAMAVLAVAKKIKGAFDKLAEKLGISFKKDLEAAFGKVGGGIINGAILVVGLPFALVGMVFATTALPFILIFGGFFGYTKFVSQDWGSSSIAIPKELKSIDYETGSSSSEYITSTGPINLPETEGSVSGQEVVNMAYSLVNKVCYWYGGGHLAGEPVDGVDPDWGVNSHGNNNSPSGTDRFIYGLDCSGFVIWVYHQLGIEVRGNVATIYGNAKKNISESELQPGDIGIEGSNDHIGIYAGRDPNGNELWIHSGGGGYLSICDGAPGYVKVGTYSGFTRFARIL